MSKEALEALKAVLCDPEGEVSIQGSKEDCLIIKQSLKEIGERLEAEEKDVWVAWTNSDLTEGRGHIKVLAVCEMQATAKRLGAGKSVQGTDCNVTCETAVMLSGIWPCGEWRYPATVIPPTKEDEARQKKEDARDAALSKAIDLGLSAQDIFDMQQV